MFKEIELRPMTSAGMFDLFKGVFIIQVIIVHTVCLFNAQSPVFYAVVCETSIMAAFFLTNGYGFRKRPTAKCIRQQIDMLLVPYVCTGILATIFHGIAHYCFFHIKESAIIESLRISAGFMLGLPRTAEYFGYRVFACGIWWFVLSMAVGLIMLSLLMKINNEKIQWTVVIIISLSGWLLCQYRNFEIPYCLSRAMVILPYLYVGYLAKKKKWLESHLPKWLIVVFILCIIVSTVIYIRTGYITDISYGIWNAGPLSVLIDGIMGFVYVWIFVRLGRYNCKLVRFFEVIGAHSFEIICVHTVEWYMPWYLLPQIFEGCAGIGCIVALLIRASIIIPGCLLVIFVKKKLAIIRRKRMMAKYRTFE